MDTIVRLKNQLLPSASVFVNVLKINVNEIIHQTSVLSANVRQHSRAHKDLNHTYQSYHSQTINQVDLTRQNYPGSINEQTKRPKEQIPKFHRVQDELLRC